MRQIVCLSTTNWHPFPTRKQQVMGRLTDSEILYFDPPVSYLAPLKDKNARVRLRAYRKEGEQPEGHPNITVYALPPVLPFANKYRWINRLNQRRLAHYVAGRMRKHSFDTPILWAYSPTSCDIVQRLPKSAVVYDCVDRHSGYKGHINPAVVDAMERDLAQAADAVFATASGLYETLSAYNKNTFMIPNGVNYSLFAEAQRVDLAVPEELADIRGPVAGFVGMLQECIDYDLITALARARPDCTIVIVGRTLPGVDISPLRAYSNIRLCGPKLPAELPAYMARFDVCLNPFRAGSLSKDVSPLKFYEYLATGKAIVSTPQPEQVLAYRNMVYIADGEEAFVAACTRAMDAEDLAMREKRIRAAKLCSWNERVREIQGYLKQLGIF